MWRAERRALEDSAGLEMESTEHRGGEAGRDDVDEDGLAVAAISGRPRLRNALVPLVVLIASVIAGLYWTGVRQLSADVAESASWTEILAAAEGNRVLLLASFVASVIAILLARLTGALDLTSSVNAWVKGLQRMLVAVLVLVLAWAVATQCDPDHLNTAGYLVTSLQGGLSAAWMPAVSFVLAGLISFATGSSWSTMGLLMPLAIPITFQLLQQEGAVPAGNDHLLVATIGAILAGAIFGDHCSPISDTTILSSAASSCDHLNHVETQFPYALTVGTVSLLVGYLPAGFGVSGWWLLPVGFGCLCLIIRTIGRPLPLATLSATGTGSAAGGGRELDAAD